MKISNASSVDNKFIKGIVYGPSGSGKTSLAKTILPYSPFIISSEAGLLSIAGTNIDYVDITQDDEGKLLTMGERRKRLTETYLFLQTMEARLKYGIVFIDSLTEIGQTISSDLAKEFPDRKDALVMWGTYNSRMRDLIKCFRDLPNYHVIFTCLSKVEKDNDNKRYAAFDCQGSIADKIPGFMDLVMYLRVKEDGSRELICQSTDSITAKDRSGKLANFEKPDLFDIFEKILHNKESVK